MCRRVSDSHYVGTEAALPVTASLDISSRSIWGDRRALTRTIGRIPWPLPIGDLAGCGQSLRTRDPGWQAPMSTAIFSFLCLDCS